MTRPVIGRDYHRAPRTYRTCSEAFGTDMDREREWDHYWSRAIVALCIVICATVLPQIWIGWL